MTEWGRDERFAAALEECCERFNGGQPLSSCLEGYPLEYRDELSRLVPITAWVGQLASDPSSEFQARTEERLLRSVDEARRRGRAGRASLVGRLFATPALRIVAFLVVAILLVGGGGVGAVRASDESLPDSPLYQVKEVRESVELVMARDPDSKVNVYTRQIAERGRELERAVRSDKPRWLVAALTLRLGRATNQMVDKALERHEQGNTAPATSALRAIRSMQDHTDRLVAQASAEEKPPLHRLAGFLQGQERRLLEKGGAPTQPSRNFPGGARPDSRIPLELVY